MLKGNAVFATVLEGNRKFVFLEMLETASGFDITFGYEKNLVSLDFTFFV